MRLDHGRAHGPAKLSVQVCVPTTADLYHAPGAKELRRAAPLADQKYRDQSEGRQGRKAVYRDSWLARTQHLSALSVALVCDLSWLARTDHLSALSVALVCDLVAGQIH